MYLVDFALFFSERKNMNKKKRIAILFAVILVVAVGIIIAVTSHQKKEMDFDEFADRFETGKSVVVDVRKESEYAAEHVEDAYSKPLAYINDWINNVDPQQHFFLHCAGGYRSMIAASILQARGYRNFTEVEGGFAAIAQTKIPKTDFICQSKVLSTQNS